MTVLDYVEARRKSPSSTIVDGRPYLPHVRADSSNFSSVKDVVVTLLFHQSPTNDSIKFPIDEVFLKENLTVTFVTGGITNTLCKVSGLSPYIEFDSVLVRIFGAEGMIDRDIENYVFALLSSKNIAPSYYGRFGNGRIEGFLENYYPLAVTDFQNESTSDAIAVEMAKLHFGFSLPQDTNDRDSGLTKNSQPEPEMWLQIFRWMEQAKKITRYKTPGDNDRASRWINLEYICDQLHWLKRDIIPLDARIVFCHNDLLAANVMRNATTGEIQLIDFEYGGYNYASYDIANHFNEHAGGTSSKENGVPNYALVPSIDRQQKFITKYLSTAVMYTEDVNLNRMDELLSLLLKEVQAFMLANHLYWGLWAVNQASVEGTDGFDYLTYAVNRFKRYDECKEEYMQSYV